MTEAKSGARRHQPSDAQPPRCRKRLRRSALALFGSVLLSTLGLIETAQAGWNVVFEDTFDGGDLDKSKWYTRYIYNKGTLDHLGNELEVYRDGDHHVLRDGMLNLVATFDPNGSRWEKYPSGMVRSHMTFRYGYFEARIKIPPGNGLHPAFWLNSDYDANGKLTWPPEIDIMESAVNGTHEMPNMIHSGVIVKKKEAQGGDFLSSDPGFNRKFGYYKLDGDVSQDFHVYGLLWAPDDTLTMYFDGKELWKRHYRWAYNGGKEAGPAHILLNLAVGGPWAGPAKKTVFPATMQVDYVRVCQPSTDAAATERCGNSQYAPQ